MNSVLKKLASGVVLAALLVTSAVTLGAAAPANATVGAPDVATTVAGETAVPETAGKARGSGLWGYAGDVQTRTEGSAFTYGLALSPADESLWVTDSAKIIWTSSTFVCRMQGGVMHGDSLCYVGESKLHRYAMSTSPDWSLGQYQGDGSYGPVAAGQNAGIGANYANLADAQNLDGTTLENGRFGGARGVAVTEAGTAWVLDSDAGYDWLSHAGRSLRMVHPDGSDAGALGKTRWPHGDGWGHRHDPDAFDFAAGIARMTNGDMISTSQVSELLKQFRPDGTFVRNIFLEQPRDTAYPGDAGYRSPYAIAVDPSDGTLLVGYADPGSGNQSFIQRIDPNDCVSEAVGAPEGSSIDKCVVLNTIGAGTLATGTGNSRTPAITFAIQVEPSSGDIYVGQRAGKLRVFERDGTPKGNFPAFGRGLGDGEVETVRSIAFDARGFMYVTVGEGRDGTRVEIFARTPDPITGLTAGYTHPAKTEATVTWDALPAGVTADAQAPVRDYVIEQSTDGGATWAVHPTPVSTETTQTLTDLDPAQSYQFRVSAWNEAGNGDWATTTVAAPLTQPAITVVKKGNGVQADSAADALHVAAASTVEFSYLITNTGDVPVELTAVTDSVLGAIAAPSGFTGTLAVAEQVEYVASGTVAAGAYRNTVSVDWREAGSQLSLTPQTAHWYGFGVTRGLSVVKLGNGEAAATTADRVSVPAGADVVFNYTITNDGNVPVTDLTLVDDQLGLILAPAEFSGELAADGGSITFTAPGPVGAGNYVNTATAAGTSAGQPVAAQTEWHGFGVTSELSVVKTGAGVAAASADQPHYTAAGSPVVFEYTVANNGNAAVTIQEVRDDVLGAIAAPAGFDGVLEAGQSITYLGSGQIPVGAYHNTVTVEATAASGGAALSATDEWFGFGVTDSLQVVKTGDAVTNDSASDARRVPAGTTVEFVYEVTNQGNAPVTLKLTDDQLGQLVGPTGFDGTLDPGQHIEYRADGPIAAGEYHNTVTVEARSATGVLLTASDDWFGFGVTDELSIVKTGAGVTTGSEREAVSVVAGATVEFGYTVTNRGNSPVTLLTLADDQIGVLVPPASFTGELGANESVDYVATGTVPLGAYRNIATVTATNEFGQELTAADDWFGFGEAGSSIDPDTNAHMDGATAAGPLSTTGAAHGDSAVLAAALLLLSSAAVLALRRHSRRTQHR